jgi:SAM-dependent methyltransferase
MGELLVFPRSPLGRLAARRVARPEWLLWFAGSGLGLDARVLDVGAGSGGLLAELGRWGFRSLEGVDPYLPGPVQLDGRILVSVGELASTQGPYDLVLFHHSLEHVDDPRRLLVDARERLSEPKGRIAVSVPVADGPVWEEFRDDWVGLDAPVHRLIPTMEGMRRLADRAGLKVVAERRTCTPYHLVASQLISQRIPVRTPSSNVLSERELAFLHRRVKAVRRSGEGPQATIALVKK